MVHLTVTDDVNPDYAVSLSLQPYSYSDPGAGIQAGDWIASPNVTDLGTHGEEPSTLTFTVVAEDTDGNRSAPRIVQALKVAITEGDTKGPRVAPRNAQGWPPQNWCRIEQSCLGVSCALSLPGALQGGSLSRACSGTARISGDADDDVAGSFGLASEIADVVIEIIRNDTGEVWMKIRSFTRRGTAAFYDATLRIGDFEPGSYTARVFAFDAWGHESNVAENSFTVHPI